jgi:23S rRNA pseudouridine2605 synthase
MERLARAHANSALVGALSHLEVHLAGLDQERLVLRDVILPGELRAGIDMENFADIPVRFSPNQLVAPRLANSSHPEGLYAITRSVMAVGVRLQKVLAHAGVASRRAAEALIVAGRVRVDGRVVTELGTRVLIRQSRVEVDGRRVTAAPSAYLVLHKPRGVVCTMHDPHGRPSVRELLKGVPAARVYPVGRLDFNTSGVLLATNDGDFADGLMHPRRAVPKTYVVKLQGEVNTAGIDALRRGLDLEDGKTRPAQVKLLRYERGKTWLELTLVEGRNRQVHRMAQAIGFPVMRLSRTAFAGVTSEGLRPGEWRLLTPDELAAMKDQYGVPKGTLRVRRFRQD